MKFSLRRQEPEKRCAGEVQTLAEAKHLSLPVGHTEKHNNEHWEGTLKGRRPSRQCEPRPPHKSNRKIAPNLQEPLAICTDEGPPTHEIPTHSDLLHVKSSPTLPQRLWKTLSATLLIKFSPTLPTGCGRHRGPPKTTLLLGCPEGLRDTEDPRA